MFPPSIKWQACVTSLLFLLVELLQICYVFRTATALRYVTYSLSMECIAAVGAGRKSYPAPTRNPSRENGWLVTMGITWHGMVVRNVFGCRRGWTKRGKRPRNQRFIPHYFLRTVTQQAWPVVTPGRKGSLQERLAISVILPDSGIMPFQRASGK
jgi:hypothetical protein